MHTRGGGEVEGLTRAGAAGRRTRSAPEDRRRPGVRLHHPVLPQPDRGRTALEQMRAARSAREEVRLPCRFGRAVQLSSLGRPAAALACVVRRQRPRRVAWQLLQDPRARTAAWCVLRYGGVRVGGCHSAGSSCVVSLRLKGWAQSSTETIETLSTIGPLRSGGGQNPVTSSLVHSGACLWKHGARSTWLRSDLYLLGGSDAVLELDELLPHIDRLKATFRSRKAVLCQSLRDHCPDLSFAEPSGGYFVWALLPDGVDADVLLAEAQTKHGVAFTPGSRCSLGEATREDGQPVDVSRFVRLSFAFYSEEEIAEGVERLRRSLDAIPHLKPKSI